MTHVREGICSAAIFSNHVAVLTSPHYDSRRNRPLLEQVRCMHLLLSAAIKTRCLQCFDVISKLGEGSYAEVVTCLNRSYTFLCESCRCSRSAARTTTTYTPSRSPSGASEAHTTSLHASTAHSTPLNFAQTIAAERSRKHSEAGRHALLPALLPGLGRGVSPKAIILRTLASHTYTATTCTSRPNCARMAGMSLSCRIDSHV